MELPIFQVDAFADRPFRGNPAAVVLLEDWLPDETLLAIAQENNLSETAFVVDGGGEVGLRWFTPAAEVDLCGHATLASAWVLFREGRTEGAEIRFRTASAGVLTVRRGEGGLLTMELPSRPAEPVPAPEGLAVALGVEPAEVMASRDLLVVLESAGVVERLRPDIGALAAIDTFGVIVTAPGTECDFVSRFFAPRMGVPEDPVTGSAHCTLVPYWSRRLSKTKLRAVQVSARRGEILCEDLGDRVALSGRVAEYLRGWIRVGEVSGRRS